MEKNQSAFPYVIPGDEKKGWDADVVEGMTLRDYFANSALKCLLKKKIISVGRSENEIIDAIVEKSYIIADAMLKQRETN